MKEYEVAIGWNGYIGVEEIYNVDADSEDKAIEYAMDEARMDLNVESTECLYDPDDEDEELDDEDFDENGEYTKPADWKVVVSFGSFLNSVEETYIVFASDEDDAINQALEEAYFDLSVEWVECTDEDDDDDLYEGCHGGKKKKSKKKVLNQKKVCGEDAKRTKNGVTFFIDDNAEPEVVRNGLVDYTLDGYVDMGDFDAPCKVGFYDGEDEPVYIFVSKGVSDDGYEWDAETIEL